MSLKDQGALVVGGASGIGLATVRLFLQQGANVTMCDVSTAGEALVKELQAEFGVKRCLFAHADVRNEAQLEAAFSVTKTTFKRLDIVVNTAGICNEQDWNLEVDVNLKGVIRGTLLAWKHMGKHEGGDGGVVVNIASIAGLMVMNAIPCYVATKWGIVGFSRSIGEAYHLNRTGVRVITICPGNTDTPIRDSVKLLVEDIREEINKIITSLKSGIQEAAHVAEAILHVIHEGSSGTVWVSEERKPAYEVQFPAYQNLRVAKSSSSSSD